MRTARRRIDLGDRHLRSGAEPRVTAAPATRAPTTTATSAKATTSTPRRSSRSTPTPASCAGTISSRRTTCTTGTRRRCRCSRDLTIGGQPRKVADVRQPQRLLLRARSRHRQGDASPAVRRDDVGEGDRRGPAAGAAAGPRPTRTGEDVPGSRRRHQLLCRRRSTRRRGSFSSPRARRARCTTGTNRRSSRASRTPAARRPGRAIEELRRAARDRSGHGAAEVGVPLYVTRRHPACCRRRRASCSPATATATSWRSTGAPARTCGTTSSGPDALHPRARPTCSTAAGYLALGSGTTVYALALPRAR